jgi:hypothetical protein
MGVLIVVDLFICTSSKTVGETLLAAFDWILKTPSTQIWVLSMDAAVVVEKDEHTSSMKYQVPGVGKVPSPLKLAPVTKFVFLNTSILQLGTTYEMRKWQTSEAEFADRRCTNPITKPVAGTGPSHFQANPIEQAA